MHDFRNLYDLTIFFNSAWFCSDINFDTMIVGNHVLQYLHITKAKLYKSQLHNKYTDGSNKLMKLSEFFRRKKFGIF